MSLQIGICDDSAEDIKILSAALYSYDSFFIISTYASGQSLLDDLSEYNILFDIIFLDIYMTGMNGIETAVKLREGDKNVKIIFVSSSNDYYTEAYDVFAFNYITKPLNKQRLNIILDQAMISIAHNQMRRRQINFSYKGQNYRIYCREIMYVESMDKNIYFHLKDKSTMQCHAKLDDILKQLPEELFVRCHQSFAVNVFHVTEAGNDYFRMDSSVVSISKKYQKSSKEKYFNYIFDHMDRGQ